MPTRDDQIVVRVSGEEKQKFEQYVEQSDTQFDSLSDLLRTATYREMNGGYVGDEIEKALAESDIGVDEDSVVNAVDVALSEQTEQLQRLTSRVSDIERMVRTSEETTSLAAELFESGLVRLPAGMSLDDIDVTSEGNSHAQQMRLAGTARSLSTLIDGFGEDAVRRALQHADDIYPQVRSTISDESDVGDRGMRRYWRVDRELEWEDADEYELPDDHDGFVPGTEVN